MTETKEVDTERLDFIIDALAHLVCSDDMRERTPWERPDIARFDGFEVVHSAEKDDLILFGDSPSDQPIWPVSVTTAQIIDDDTLDTNKCWQFSKYETLDKKKWSGRLQISAPKMLERSVLWASRSGFKTGETTPLALLGQNVVRANPLGLLRGSWGSPPPAYWGHMDHDWRASVASVGGFALRRRYYWSVLLGEGSGPRARFLTDPIGVREAFRLRDIPPGKQRRAALLHWVREHWRKSRKSEIDRIAVREHLRGARSYVWNGLRCEISPSDEDSERI